MEEIIGEIEYINIEMTQVERKDKLDTKKWIPKNNVRIIQLF